MEPSRRSMMGLASGAALLAAFAARAQGTPPGTPPDPSKPFYTAPDQALPYKPFRVKGSDGVTIAAQEWGNPAGPAIVFIHGVLQSHLSFERQVQSNLAKSFRMITYDLRGQGDSEKPLGQEHYLDGALWADDLKAVMDAAEVHRPVLVGWSLAVCRIACTQCLDEWLESLHAELHSVQP